VVVQSAPAMDDAGKAGALKADSRVPVRARRASGIGGAPRRAAVPDVSTPRSVQEDLMAAGSIVVTDPAMPNASGALTQRILNEAGVMDAIKPQGESDRARPRPGGDLQRRDGARFSSTSARCAPT